MTPFEALSKEIDEISQLHSTSRIVRLACRFEFVRRRYWSNEPMCFQWVGDKGVPVGAPIPVIHIPLHDMMPHQARGIVTGKVLLEGLRANAIQRLGFERLDDVTGRTMIQPRWIDGADTA